MAESEGNLTAARTKSNEVEAKLGAAPSELFARLFPDIQGCTEEKAALHISILNSPVPAGDEVEKLRRLSKPEKRSGEGRERARDKERNM